MHMSLKGLLPPAGRPGPRTLPSIHFSAKSRPCVLAAAQKNNDRSLNIVYTTDRRAINGNDVAQLLSEVAASDRGRPADARSPGIPHCTPSDAFKSGVTVALKNSLVFVAAYVPQQVLLREAGRLSGTPPPPTSWLETMLPSAGPKALVGFARAVGDAALVATVHDVAVHPALRRRGIGRALLERLTRQLYNADIIDVGALVPTSAERFFERCRFGDDSEESITMRLIPKSEAGLWRSVEFQRGGRGKALLPPVYVEETAIFEQVPFIFE